MQFLIWNFKNQIYSPINFRNINWELKVFININLDKIFNTK